MNKIGNGLVQLALKPVVKSIGRGSKKLFSRKYLLYTNITLTVGLSFAGDVVQQNYQILNKKLNSWDKKRTLHVACTGFAVGPFCHYWYLFLDKWMPGRTLKVVLRKILVDQLVCSPVFIGTFLLTLCLMESASWEKTKSDLIEKGKTLYTADWIVWPPAQLINFLFLPTRYRVLYDNGIAFGFDCYFSYVRYDKDYDQEKSTAQEKDDSSDDINVDNEDQSNNIQDVQCDNVILKNEKREKVCVITDQHIFS